MLEMKRPNNIWFIVIQVPLYCLHECCMMNLKDHYFKSVLFYKPQGTLGSKYKVNKYHKILKICAGAYIFQRPFLRGLFLEGLIFGGAYVRREIRVSKSIGLASYLEGSLPFFLVLLCIWGQFSKYKLPGGLYLEGRFNGGFLRYWFGGLIFVGAYFQNFTVIKSPMLMDSVVWRVHAKR